MCWTTLTSDPLHMSAEKQKYELTPQAGKHISWQNFGKNRLTSFSHLFQYMLQEPVNTLYYKNLQSCVHI